MSSRYNPPARVSNLKFKTSPAALRPSTYRLPLLFHLIWFSSVVVRPHTCPSGAAAALRPPSDAMCSLLPLCADEDIFVVVNAAAISLVVDPVDEVVVLVARHGGRCHAFLFVFVRWQVRCRRRSHFRLAPLHRSTRSTYVARQIGRASCHVCS